MLNAVYQLKRPRQFELVFKDITFDQEHVIVRPTHLSICNADQRYYQGNRPEEVLKQKLPMALIHEAIGRVVYDPTHQFQVGDNVVMIPNLPSEEDDVIAENYLRSSRFRASGTDGFLQEYVETVPDRLVRLPENINLAVAAFTEIVSVSFHAVDRFMKTAHARRDVIGVWGDGNLGYITSLLLKSLYPEIQVYIMGVNESKLNDFTFADGTYLVNEIPKGFHIDHALECVGGNGAPRAINQIIDYINPEGTIAILGVTEDLAPINTRMVLEKGLRIIGSSRSGREDFVNLVELYKERPEVVDYLENIVGEQIKVREIKDIARAFEMDIHKLIGKTIMIWDK
ncbi:MAG: zinc-binding dehydrogenase [Lachnospiraceae bacterium]|nr:zinc-binding dehydrogenase [Lachnospiraceae bacterium]MDE6627004.1 zinc-binding dehydrogenase [Lachnospiraceae bacterium]